MGVQQIASFQKTTERKQREESFYPPVSPFDGKSGQEVLLKAEQGLDCMREFGKPRYFAISLDSNMK
jgi:hypothetical protein